MNSSAHTYRPLTLVWLIFTALFIAWIVGALTNFAGALVFADYYPMVLGWTFTDDRFAAIIAQGLFEATFAGLIAGFLYAAVVACRSRTSCPFQPAALHLLRWTALLPISWFLGGSIALLLRFLSPHQLVHILTFAAPATASLPPEQLTHFSWVAGTIIGIYAGSIFAVLFASLTFPARWRRIRLQLHMKCTGHTSFCIVCGYNQRRTTGNRCPECGATIRIEKRAAVKINTGEMH